MAWSSSLQGGGVPAADTSPTRRSRTPSRRRSGESSVKSTSSSPLDPVTYVRCLCREHHISRSYLYLLWNEGREPRRTKVGRRTLISGEAAADWRRKLEAETTEHEGVDS